MLGYCGHDRSLDKLGQRGRIHCDRPAGSHCRICHGGGIHHRHQGEVRTVHGIAMRSLGVVLMTGALATGSYGLRTAVLSHMGMMARRLR
jgi:hypothetical protein